MGYKHCLEAQLQCFITNDNRNCAQRALRGGQTSFITYKV